MHLTRIYERSRVVVYGPPSKQFAWTIILQSALLVDKIDELAKRNLLTSAQVELLHEERYIGNAALHELETPSPQDIEDGLGIVEGLINTIYILPSKAKRLKERREAKKKPKPKGRSAKP